MLALDTDILIHWVNADCEYHGAVSELIQREVSQRGTKLALVPQVCWEFMHVVTDARRFDQPLSMDAALDRVRKWWDAPEVVRVAQDLRVVHRTVDLMQAGGLGRKRILDTVLASTLEVAGIPRLATLNGADYRLFHFIEVVDPRE